MSANEKKNCARDKNGNKCKDKKKEKKVDEGLRESFPASDPPASHQITGK